MKAWVVGEKDGWGGFAWCTLIHAETRGKAIYEVQSTYNTGDFTDYRAVRLPGLDDKPITYENAAAAGFLYLDDTDGEPAPSNEFLNECRCEICRGEKT